MSLKKSGPIYAVVLAAGESKRMGTPKALLPWGGTTVLEAVLVNILSSSVDRTLVVLGAERARTGPLVQKYSASAVFNPDFRTGMLSSVQTGFRALPAECRAALVFLADQPWVRKEVIGRVISAYFETDKGLVVPVYKGFGGHPFLVDMKYRKSVETLHADVGLRELLSLYPQDIKRINIEDSSILLDLDTPADYRRSRAAKPPRRG